MADYEQKLAQKKHESTLQLLFRASRLVNEEAIRRVQARTGREVRTSHTSLLPHIDLQGTRLTELARRMGVTKQAVGQLVDELVEMGMLERIQDPEDGRGKLICFTEAGRQEILAGLHTLQALEAELSVAIGPVAWQQFLTGLLGILASVG